MKTYKSIGVVAEENAQSIDESLVFDPRPDGNGCLRLAVIAGGTDTGIYIHVHRNDNTQGSVITCATKIQSFEGDIYDCKRHVLATALRGLVIPSQPMTADERADTELTR